MVRVERRGYRRPKAGHVRSQMIYLRPELREWMRSRVRVFAHIEVGHLGEAHTDSDIINEVWQVNEVLQADSSDKSCFGSEEDVL